MDILVQNIKGKTANLGPDFNDMSKGLHDIPDINYFKEKLLTKARFGDLKDCEDDSKKVYETYSSSFMFEELSGDIALITKFLHLWSRNSMAPFMAMGPSSTSMGTRCLQRPVARLHHRHPLQR